MNLTQPLLLLCLLGLSAFALVGPLLQVLS